jgi:dihydrofolate reductase
MKFFRKLTANSTVIMGRKTWESIGGKPLPKRLNLVISSTLAPSPTVFKTLSQALSSIPSSDKEIWVIGGSGLYKEAMNHPATTHLHVTRVTPAVPAEYDAFLTDVPYEFVKVEEGEELSEYCREKGLEVGEGFPRVREENGNDVEFTVYKRRYILD